MLFVQQFATIRRILRIRNDLWNSFHVAHKSLDLPRIIITWRWLRREFRQLQASYDANSSVKVTESLATLFGRVDEALGLSGSTRAGNTKQHLSRVHALWKKGGHNFGYHTSQLLDIALAFDALMNELSYRPDLPFSKQALARLSRDDRESLVHALATLQWLNAVNTNTLMSDKDAQLIQELADSISKVPAVIRSAIDNAPKAIKSAGALEEDEDNSHKLITATEEHTSLRIELSVLSQVFSALVDYFLSTNENARAQNELNRLCSHSAPVLLDHAIDRCNLSRLPSDFGNYQLLRWLFDGNSSPTATHFKGTLD